MRPTSWRDRQALAVASWRWLSPPSGSTAEEDERMEELEAKIDGLSVQVDELFEEIRQRFTVYEINRIRRQGRQKLLSGLEKIYDLGKEISGNREGYSRLTLGGKGADVMLEVSQIRHLIKVAFPEGEER